MLKEVEDFSTRYGKCDTFIVDKNARRIEYEDLESELGKYESKCCLRCDDEIRRAFKFKSMKEYENAMK